MNLIIFFVIEIGGLLFDSILVKNYMHQVTVNN